MFIKIYTINRSDGFSDGDSCEWIPSTKWKKMATPITHWQLETSESQILEITLATQSIKSGKGQRPSHYQVWAWLRSHISTLFFICLCSTGIPHDLYIQSSSSGRHRTFYNLTWTLKSFAPLEETEVSYKAMVSEATLFLRLPLCKFPVEFHSFRVEKLLFPIFLPRSSFSPLRSSLSLVQMYHHLTLLQIEEKRANLILSSKEISFFLILQSWQYNCWQYVLEGRLVYPL